MPSGSYARRRSLRGLLMTAMLTIGITSSALVAPPANAGAALTAADPAVKVADSLERAFAGADESQDFWVTFTSTADTAAAKQIDGWRARGALVTDRLRSTASGSQAAARKLLAANGIHYKSFWITNAIRVDEGSQALALELARLPEVSAVISPVRYRAIEPVERKPQSKTSGTKAADEVVEWGIQQVKADRVWKSGVRGDGIVVASIDTGVQFEHPALVDSYRGNNGDGTFTHDYNWLDTRPEAARSTFPVDGNGHGTHTMGTMVGDDGATNQVGMAPGARWISANGCCASDETLIASAQWMLAPTDLAGKNPKPELRPNVVNNSWSSTQPSTDPFMEDLLKSWADSGILGVFANGNNGPGCNTSGSPGSRTLNFSVGAYDKTGTIAGFSSRGPGQDGEIKPNISAPGAGVRSAYLRGQYATMSGTSMAAPHLAGAAALLWSAVPSLTGKIAETRQLLEGTAIDTADDQCGGTASDNNVYGEGRLDALALVAATPPPPTGTITGRILDDESGEPVAAARISLAGNPYQRSARSDATGTYSVTIPAGEYSATVKVFGFADKTTTIQVSDGQTTTTDVRLARMPGSTLIGRVIDDRTGKPVPESTITLSDGRYRATTSAVGAFTMSRVPGPAKYLVTVDGGPCNRPATVSVTMPAEPGQTVDLGTIRLWSKTDQPSTALGRSYGYGCVHEPVKWIEGDRDLPLPPEDQTPVKVELPFSYGYYGRFYDALYLTRNGRLSPWPFTNESSAYASAGISLMGTAMAGPNSRVRTKSAGVAPNRSFTVEYVDFERYLCEGSYSHEITIHENGDIVMGYRIIGPEYAPDCVGRIAIDDRQTGGGEGFDGSARNMLTYRNGSNFAEAPRNSVQIRFGTATHGVLTGVVTDRVTGRPVPGATVDVTTTTGVRAWRARTDSLGRYTVQLFTGKLYTVSILKPSGYRSAPPFQARVTSSGLVVRQDRSLDSARIKPTPAAVTASPGKDPVVTLANTGNVDLNWRLAKYGSARQPSPGTVRSMTDLSGVLEPSAFEQAGGHRWVSGNLVEVREPVIAEITQSGDVTGHRLDMAAVASAIGATRLSPGDLAWSADTRNLCTTIDVADAGRNDIACADPASPWNVWVVRTGVNPATARVSGLAYDNARDLFYVLLSPQSSAVSRATLVALHGLEHAAPGTPAGTCLLGRSASGLAYNPTTRTLWTTAMEAQVGKLGQHLVEFDPSTCAENADLEPGYTEDVRQLGGLGLDDSGNFLVRLRVLFDRGVTAPYLADVQARVPTSESLPWLTFSQASGTLAPDAGRAITVKVNWSLVPAGVTSARLVIRGNGGAAPAITVPITLKR